MQPAARAGNTFTMLRKNGKLNGVIAATTPTGSRTTACPAIPVGPPAGGDTSVQPHRELHGFGDPLGDVDGAADLDDVGEEADRPGLGHHQLLEQVVAFVEDRGEAP